MRSRRAERGSMRTRRGLLLVAAALAAASALPAGAHAATTVVGSCSVTTGPLGGSCSIPLPPSPGVFCDAIDAACSLNGGVEVTGVVVGLVKGSVTVSGFTDTNPASGAFNYQAASKSRTCGPALSSCQANTFTDQPAIGHRLAFFGGNAEVSCSSMGSLGITAVVLTCTAFRTA